MYILPILWIKSYDAFLEKVVINDYERLGRVLFCLSGCEWCCYFLGVRGVWAGQGRAGQGRAGQGRAGQGRAGQGRAGQGRAPV